MRTIRYTSPGRDKLITIYGSYCSHLPDVHLSDVIYVHLTDDNLYYNIEMIYITYAGRTRPGRSACTSTGRYVNSQYTDDMIYISRSL